MQMLEEVAADQAAEVAAEEVQQQIKMAETV
jgi:hypothetical protein